MPSEGQLIAKVRDDTQKSMKINGNSMKFNENQWKINENQ